MRELAIQAIISVLNAMPEVAKVLRTDTVTKIARTAFPAVIVLDDGNETRNPKTNGMADVFFTLYLKGAVIGKDQSTAMNNLDKAIKAAIYADLTLGGTVANIKILSREQTDLDGGETLATFVRPIEIYYEANEANGD